MNEVPLQSRDERTGRDGIRGVRSLPGVCWALDSFVQSREPSRNDRTHAKGAQVLDLLFSRLWNLSGVDGPLDPASPTEESQGVSTLHAGRVSSSSSFLSSLKLSDTKVYEPHTRSHLGTTSRFCDVVVLKSRNLPKTPSQCPWSQTPSRCLLGSRLWNRSGVDGPLDPTEFQRCIPRDIGPRYRAVEPSSGSNHIPRRDRPGLAGLRLHNPAHRWSQ